jgi:protein O-mannosyl-transferase
LRLSLNNLAGIVARTGLQLKPMREPRRALLLPLLQTSILISVALLAYFPTFHNGFIWDDDFYIQKNLNLLNAGGLRKIWFTIGSEPQYYPLTHTSFWLEYHALGRNPLIYHLDNLLLHVASSLLLWRLLRRIEIPGAFLAAMIFCIHPVQAESVAWATERKNVLSGLLYLLSFSAYWRFDNANRKWGWYAISIFLFALALLAKSVTSTLPAAILILIWFKRGQIRLRDVVPLLPMFIAGAAMGSLTRWMEMHIVGAIGPEFPSSFLQRICVAGGAVWFYLGKLLWPVNLMFIYPHWNIDPAQKPWLLGFAVAVIACLIALWCLRDRIGRGPLAAFLFFIVTLSPALGFVNVFPMRYSYVADHFQYLACIGPIVLFAAILSRCVKPSMNVAVAAVIVILFCIHTNAQCRIYRDSATLWRDTIAKDPNSWMAHENLGQAFEDSGDWSAAQKEYRIALGLYPQEPTLYTKLGVCAVLDGNDAQGIQLLQQALQHMPDSTEPVLHNRRSEPNDRMGWAFNFMADRELAKVPPNEKLAEQDRQLAIDAYRQAIAINPQYELAMLDLGLIFRAQGKLDSAIDEFQQAIAVNPDSVYGHYDLGNALLAKGLKDQAIDEFQQVLRIRPQDVDAINNIGAIYADQQKWPQAIAEFQLALRIDPNFDLARQNLAAALARQ